jgi:ATP-dependent Lon protease
MDFTYQPPIVTPINTDNFPNSGNNSTSSSQVINPLPANTPLATHFTTSVNPTPVSAMSNSQVAPQITQPEPVQKQELPVFEKIVRAPQLQSEQNSQSVQSVMSQAAQDDYLDDIELLAKQTIEAKMPKDLEERALRYIERLRKSAKRGSTAGEYESIEKYIYWITRVPWNVKTDDNLDIANAKVLMDSTHYGMDVVKDLILDYLAVMQLQLKQGKNKAGEGASTDMAMLRGSSANAPVMLFVGLQGVGKTSIAKSIAKAMGRKFIRVALGAIGDVKVLRGSPRGYPDSEPGQIIKSMVRAGTTNPIILLDEIDKSSGNASLLSDVMAALLEILDPEQNATFVDHYVDYPVDLSKVFFICTANNLGTLSAALLDRMEVIRFTSYSDSEKEVIARKYSFPKVIKNSGLSEDMVQLTDDAWPMLIRPVGFDAGLRQLERNLATLVRSAARKILEGAPTPLIITPANIREFVLPDQGPLS